MFSWIPFCRNRPRIFESSHAQSSYVDPRGDRTFCASSLGWNRLKLGWFHFIFLHAWHLYRCSWPARFTCFWILQCVILNSSFYALWICCFCWFPGCDPIKRHTTYYVVGMPRVVLDPLALAARQCDQWSRKYAESIPIFYTVIFWYEMSAVKWCYEWAFLFVRFESMSLLGRRLGGLTNHSES